MVILFVSVEGPRARKNKLNMNLKKEEGAAHVTTVDSFPKGVFFQGNSQMIFSEFSMLLQKRTLLEQYEGSAVFLVAFNLRNF